jgi:hypothetical protein
MVNVNDLPRTLARTNDFPIKRRDAASTFDSALLSRRETATFFDSEEPVSPRFVSILIIAATEN